MKSYTCEGELPALTPKSALLEAADEVLTRMFNIRTVQLRTMKRI